MGYLAGFTERWVGDLSTVFFLFFGIYLAILLAIYSWDRVLRPRFSNHKKALRGTTLATGAIIGIASLAVLVTGLSVPQVMIGDEVTHYYMLTEQSKDLSKPNFYAKIPIANGDVETRRYPHPFLWHYFGGLLYALSGNSFAAIQIYQALFLVQLLTVAYLLARDRDGAEPRSALVYVLILASLPLNLLFSVAFYQDVPMTAQIVTAFYLLRKERWFWASLFLSLAIGFKVTAVLFFPAFFLLLVIWQTQKRGWVRAASVTIVSLAIVLGATWGIGRAIVVHGNSYFYPQAQIERIIKKTREVIEAKLPVISKKTGLTGIPEELSARPNPQAQETENKPAIIANHPGDLRIKENYLVYGGLLLWPILGMGIVGQALFSNTHSLVARKQPVGWLYLVGGSYLLIAYWYIRTAPDARFFLPGIPFVLLPFVEKSVCLPKPRMLVTLIATLALLQGGLVLQKSYALRAISPDIREGIEYLKNNPPSGRVFMYPEGNYRFFPAQHEWYLGYRLREFWRAENDERIRLLHKFRVSMIVVKRHLITPVDDEITNLGVYPPEFVVAIDNDPRFRKVFANDQLIFFAVPE